MFKATRLKEHLQVNDEQFEQLILVHNLIFEIRLLKLYFEPPQNNNSLESKIGLPLFSCEDAAQQVLKCPSVCLCVCP